VWVSRSLSEGTFKEIYISRMAGEPASPRKGGNR